MLLITLAVESCYQFGFDGVDMEFKYIKKYTIVSKKRFKKIFSLSKCFFSIITYYCIVCFSLFHYTLIRMIPSQEFYVNLSNSLLYLDSKIGLKKFE